MYSLRGKTQVHSLQPLVLSNRPLRLPLLFRRPLLSPLLRPLRHRQMLPGQYRNFRLLLSVPPSLLRVRGRQHRREPPPREPPNPHIKAQFPLHPSPQFHFRVCAHALAEPIGVAGFGRGALSLPAQLSAFSRHLGSRFSYCLISHSFNSNRLRQPSPLILGRSETAIVEGEKFVFTPMLDNPKHPYFYSVGLEAVSVGRKRIPAPENMRTVNHKGDGGVVVDSGTTFTMLPPGTYAAVLDEFDNNMGGKYERTVATEEATGLGRCYFYGEKKKVTAPGVALHFAGNASVALPRRNYFTGFLRESGGRKRKVGCLMVMSGGDEADSGGPAATLGNFQQQGFEVVYDLERRRVGFARRQCASLWESLSRD